MKYRIERLDLFKERVGETLPADHRNAGHVVDRLLGIKLGALAARLSENVDQMAFNIDEPKLKDGEEPYGPRPDDDGVGLDGLAHSLARLADRRA
jgi:hypothetical protein